MAAPEFNVTAPLDPELVVPEVKYNSPLIPLAPALLVFTITDPLDLVEPKPVCKEIAPPVVSIVLPASMTPDPPTSVRSSLFNPEPISIIIRPEDPVDSPVNNISFPVSPELEVPVLNFKIPLAPAVPASTERIRNIPLDVAVPSPATNDI